MTCSLEKMPPISTRPSDMRRAWDDDDRDAFFAAVKKRCAVNARGCWIWKGHLTRDGYAEWCEGKRPFPLHRAVLQMREQHPLGIQQCHHVCADTRCVNPDHLQLVTERQNIAEMQQRQTYVALINQLANALKKIDPGNPALHIAGFEFVG